MACSLLLLVSFFTTGAAATQVVVWGSNRGMTNLPSGLTNAVAVAAGVNTSLALNSDGTVVAWPLSFTVGSLDGIVAVADATDPTLALRTNGAIAVLDGSIPSSLGPSNVVAVASGAHQNLVLRANGTVVAWGSNLNNNHYGQTNVPPWLSDVVAIASGGDHSLALEANGTLVGWGDNTFGQTNIPAGLVDVVAIAAGTSHCLALRADGTVVAWGGNQYGQTNVPAGLTNVIKIAAGYNDNLALRSDGTLVAWGDNSLKQTSLPAGLTNVIGMAVGTNYCLALTGSIPPFVQTPLAPRGILIGKSTRFIADVAGTQPISYQWTFAGTNLPGATNAALLLTNAGFETAGFYSLIVTNDLGSTIVPPWPLNVYQIAAWGGNYSDSLDVPPGLTNVVQVVAGAYGGIALKTDKTVSTWGTMLVSPPADLTNVAGIAAGLDNGAALLADGTVTCWGGNSYGQSLVPAGLSNVVQVAAAGYHVVALKSDGTVAAWGENGAIAPLTAGLTNIVEVAASRWQAIALRADGSVVVFWPTNASGSALTNVPLNVTNVVQIAGSESASTAHFLTLGDDGTVTTVGYGQPAVPPDLTNAVALAAGEMQNMSILPDGTIRVWWLPQPSPATNPPAGLSNVVVAASGGFHCLALIGNGPPVLTTPLVDRTAVYGLPVRFRAWATGSWPLSYQWLFNGQPLPGATNPVLKLDSVQFSQAGNYSVVVTNAFGTAVSRDLQLRVAPVLLLSQPQPQNLVLGMNTVLSAQALGENLAYQWQLNGVSLAGQTGSTLTLTNLQFAQEGNYTVVITNQSGSVTSQVARVQISQVAAWGDNTHGQCSLPDGVTNILEVAAGRYHNLALKSDGTAVAWGDNTYGQASVPPGITNLIALSAGDHHNLALTADEQVLCWGSGPAGETNTPPGLSNVVAVAAGFAHSLALRSDGSVAAWGDNTYGQTNLPSDLSNVVAIAAGAYHSLALKQDGTLAAWGDNSLGQLRMPQGLAGVVAIAAGAYHSLVLLNDGSMLAWGSNPLTFGIANPPKLTNVVAIAGGATHDLALLADGSVTGWGDNSVGQLSPPLGLANATAIAAGYSHSLALAGYARPVTQVAAIGSNNPSAFSVTVPTQCGKVYGLEYKDSLADPTWQLLPLVPGTGATRIFTNAAPASTSRFYRVVRW